MGLLGGDLRLIVFFLLACLSFEKSLASVGFLLHESMGSPWFVNRKVYTGFLAQGGHSAIYLSELCSDIPTKIRRCVDNEPRGVVISRYSGISKEEYDWLAVPANPYFWGVEKPAWAPLVATDDVQERLAERFYEKFLFQSVAETTPGQLPEGRWRDLVAATLRRDIYSFNLKSDSLLEDKILSDFDDDGNTSKFNFFLGNCADFVGDFFKEYFSDFQRTNLADTGLTSPKGVAQSVAKLAKTQLNYSVTKYSQVPGVFVRSHQNLFPFENAIRNHKYTLLLAHYQPILQIGFGLVWGLGFRFNPHEEHRNFFSREVEELNYVRMSQSNRFDRINEEVNKSETAGSVRAIVASKNKLKDLIHEIDGTKRKIKVLKEAAFGSKAQWSEIKTQLASQKTQYRLPDNLLKTLNKQSHVEWQGDSLIMTWGDSPWGRVQAIVAGEGIGSGDPNFVRWLILTRLDYFVNTSEENRPMIAEVQKYFKALEEVL